MAKSGELDEEESVFGADEAVEDVVDPLFGPPEARYPRRHRKRVSRYGIDEA